MRFREHFARGLAGIPPVTVGLALAAFAATPAPALASSKPVASAHTWTHGSDGTDRRTRICAPVTFAGVADFRLVRIRATGVGCVTARRVARGARLHERWQVRGFHCNVTKVDPEVATYYRCSDGPRRRITFKTA
jgi:hypothetical protein